MQIYARQILSSSNKLIFDRGKSLLPQISDTIRLLDLTGLLFLDSFPPKRSQTWIVCDLAILDTFWSPHSANRFLGTFQQTKAPDLLRLYSIWHSRFLSWRSPSLWASWFQYGWRLPRFCTLPSSRRSCGFLGWVTMHKSFDASRKNNFLDVINLPYEEDLLRDI